MKTIQGEKYIWHMPDEHTDALSLSAQYNLSFPIIQTLLSRGFTTKESIDNFLFSSVHKDVAHPSLLKDAQKAVDRILYAIQHNEKILVSGDYDVDGITSSALMMLCLMPLGAQVNFFLPHRVHDGYGLSRKTVQRAAQNNYKVIITVDNGITAFEPANLAKQLGIDLIITDHHRPHPQLPNAFAIINPHQEDCPYPYKKFAGVGVSFKLLSLLYEKLNLPLPPKAYELLLLGTIADVVPLTGENRFWVRHGLQYVNSIESESLKVLKSNGKVTREKITSTDIGFFLTPQINALGRLEDPRQGVKFLIGSDVDEVESVGRVLCELNQARKAIEKGIFDSIVQQIDAGIIDTENDYCIMASSTQWPPGVIGLVASRLVAAYGKPVLLFHITSDGIAKGSCRSIPAFNMFDALSDLRHLLVSFGGHSMAAGLALSKDNLQELKEQLERLMKERITQADLKQKIVIDASLPLSDLNKKFVDDLHYLEPFGHENPAPIFMIQQVTLVQAPQLMKELHVKCFVFAEGIIKPVVFFNRPELYEKFLACEQNSFSIAAQISENHWNGKTSIELVGLDAYF